MAFGWVQKNVSPIALDLGAESIKLLQIIPDDPPKLVAAASIDIPYDARKNAELHRTFVSSALKELLRDGKFKGRRAIAAISASHSHVQHVRLAKGDPTMIEQMLEIELRGRVPFYPAGMVIRHVPVCELVADGQAKQEVICFAASREAVLRQVGMARAAGLDVVGMHCEPVAILASFAHLFRRAEDVNRTTLFLDMGAATTKALIAHGKQIVFAKTIQVGGDHFVRQLSDRMKIEPAAAKLLRNQQATEAAQAVPPTAQDQPAVSTQNGARRQYTHNLGAPLAGSPQPQDTQGTATSAATATVDAPAPAGAIALADDAELLETLVDELQLCLGYHGSVFADRPVEKIVFLGGESRQLGTCQHIAKALRLPAQLGDPLARLVRSPGTAPPSGVDLRQPQPGWSVPLGLCLLPTNL